MRMMGADSVAHHRETIIERGDDFPGATLEYYASRGETPLLWGGKGAESLGLVGPVDNPSYDALYGPGGARHPATGERIVTAQRPGMELVIAAHKSVAELGVLGRAEDMHAIMDAERDATLRFLDDLTRARGGRRGVAAVPTATTGLVYAHARHATTRAGDPGPHDHVLIANVIEMLDGKGGTKAPDTTLWREHLHAATMVGRVASAATAVQLGYGIEADNGPSGKLGHWKIAGIPDAALAVHSKRSVEISEAVAEKGFSTYQARQVAARETRKAKRHTSVEDLLPRWRAELTTAGYPPDQLLADIERAGLDYQPQHNNGNEILGNRALTAIAEDLLGPAGTLSARKVFAKRVVIVAVAPMIFGLPATELDKVTTRVLRDPDAIPLVGVPRASEQAYGTAHVIATELAIEQAVERGVENREAARVTPEVAAGAVVRQSADLGSQLTPGQLAAVLGIATSGRGVELVEGVAGSGKTTVMAAVRDAFETSGFTVVGTSTSGQAVRTLGKEAGLSESRTLASLRWRLEHDRMRLTPHHVLVLDEAGMAADRDVAFLLDQARLAGSKVVMVGDDRQLGAVSVGGPWGPWSNATAGSCTPSTRTSDSAPTPNGRPWPNFGPATSPGPSGSISTTDESSASGPAPRRSTPWSTSGRQTPFPARTPPCSPGGGPTWPSSTAWPESAWQPRDDSPGPSWWPPGVPTMRLATGSSPWPLQQEARWSPPSGAWSRRSTGSTCASPSRWRMAGATGSNRKRRSVPADPWLRHHRASEPGGHP